MHMFGNANWYFPRWLDRIVPRLSVEPADELTAEEATVAPSTTPAGGAR
jgi:RND superfamily putative drug exporter